MVELRKRKTPPPAEPPSKKAKADPKAAKPPKAAAAASLPPPPEDSIANEGAAANLTSAAPAPATVTASTSSKPPTAAAGAAPTSIKTGETLPISSLSLPIQTQDATSTTLSTLLTASTAGIVLFTYPKASTPGCTTQACLFRDSYSPLTASGLSIYGLSNDSPKSNSTFKSKQNLPFELLCDAKGALIKAVGLGKAGGKTARGVVVLGKEGVVRAWEQGGPARTVDVVREVVEAMGGEGEVLGKDEVEKSEKVEVETAES